MHRTPYRKGRKKRPTLAALIEHRPPNPGRTAGGIGWEYVYPMPEHDQHEDPGPCDEPGCYDATPGDRMLGPIEAIVTGGEVSNHREPEPWLHLRLTVRLHAVNPGQRRALAGLIRAGRRITLTLVGESGGEERSAG